MARFDTNAGAQGRRIGRYDVLGEIASGGMATVYLARSQGAKGFSRLMAIKRLHPHLEAEDDFVQMFLDEARLAARIRHPNVVATLDVEDSEGLYIVMEYIEGVTLLTLSRAAQKSDERIPVPVVARIVLDTLGGLHAAHELLDDTGEFLGLVHRDVSPQNILVGTDGSSRLTDFGIAKAASRLTMTRDGQLKGKISYMAPEQTRRVEIDRRVDLFAMGICTWELLAGKRLFQGDSDVEVLNQLLFEPIPRLKDHAPSIPAGLEEAVMKALERDPADRYASAMDFAEAIEKASRVLGGPANHRVVAAFVQKVAGERIARERGRIASGASPTELTTGSWKAVDTPPVTPSRVRPTGEAPVPAARRPTIAPPAGGVVARGQQDLPSDGSSPRVKAPVGSADLRSRAPTLTGGASRFSPQRHAPSIPPRSQGPGAYTPPAPMTAVIRQRASTVMGTGPRAGVGSDFDPELATISDASPGAHPDSMPIDPEFDPPAPGEATLIESSPEAFIARQIEIDRNLRRARETPEEIELEPDDDFPSGSMREDEVATNPPREGALFQPTSTEGYFGHSAEPGRLGAPSFAPLPHEVIPPPAPLPVFDAPPSVGRDAWSMGAGSAQRSEWQIQGSIAPPAPAAPIAAGSGSRRNLLVVVAVLALAASAAIAASVLLRERRVPVRPPPIAVPAVPSVPSPPTAPPAPEPLPIAAAADAGGQVESQQPAADAGVSAPAQPEAPPPEAPPPEAPPPEAPPPEVQTTDRPSRSGRRHGESRRHRSRDPDDLELSPLLRQLPPASSDAPVRAPAPAPAPAPRPVRAPSSDDAPDLGNPYRN